MYLTQICSTHERCILTANSNYPQEFLNSSNTILHWSTVWAHFHIMQNTSALFFTKSVTTSWLEEKSTYGSSLKNKRWKLQSYSEYRTTALKRPIPSTCCLSHCPVCLPHQHLSTSDNQIFTDHQYHCQADQKRHHQHNTIVTSLFPFNSPRAVFRHYLIPP